MVFTTTNLFKGIQCPEGTRCALTNCIFAHDLQPQAPKPDVASRPVPLAVDEVKQTITPTDEPPTKKRKVTYSSINDKPPSRADQIRNQLAAARDTKAAASSQAKDVVTNAQGSHVSQTPSSLSRPVSPPAIGTSKPKSGQGLPVRVTTDATSTSSQSTPQAQADLKTEKLNPRLIANDPAGHAKRSLYLKHLHAETVRLNQKAAGEVPADLKGSFPLSEQMMIKIVLDEEEKIAREQPSIYANIIKSRLAQLKKISASDWIQQIKALLPSAKPAASKSNEKPIDTRLTLAQEPLILPHLITDQTNLDKFEYITSPPTAEQIAKAVQGVEQSKNYEECDRCAARFQVFPDRNEEGLLASNGPCRHHPNRKVYPQREKTDKETGPKQPYYPCCMELVGTPGCTVTENHVFKTASPGRLAAVLPFIVTPENTSPEKDRDGKEVKAVTFDCEMGYTVFGIELIRLTAVSWPENKELIDVLVRPLGTIIDLNSRFSGVFPEHFTNAIPYEEWQPSRSPQSTTEDSQTTVLPIVASPQKARELLCHYLTPTTPLIGHAINNDLNTTRLCHPTIIDTVVLYPHPRGLPMRLGLKSLAHRYINRAIQTGGARGHDSREDAVATGDLVRIKVGDKWKHLRAAGWKIVDDKLVPPSPCLTAVAATAPGEGDKVAAGSKRKRDAGDGEDAEKQDRLVAPESEK